MNTRMDAQTVLACPDRTVPASCCCGCAAEELGRGEHALWPQAGWATAAVLGGTGSFSVALASIAKNRRC